MNLCKLPPETSGRWWLSFYLLPKPSAHWLFRQHSQFTHTHKHRKTQDMNNRHRSAVTQCSTKGEKKATTEVRLTLCGSHKAVGMLYLTLYLASYTGWHIREVATKPTEQAELQQTMKGSLSTRAHGLITCFV
jgi:hypothetical protein